ncbi:MAG: OmpA family protein [Bacteroidota bacterium]
MRVLLVFLLFIVYALFARWYYVCQLKGLCEEKVERPMTLQLTDEEGAVLLEGYEQFAFDTTKVLPNLTDNNKLFLDKVAEYVKAHPDKNLTITGFYRPSEEGRSSGMFENLGVARADRIRSLLARRGIGESRITLDYAKASDEMLTTPLAFELFTPELPSDFDKTAFTFTNMTFSDANFEYNSAAFNPGTQLQTYADSVSTFLELNPDRSLTIVGHTDSIGSDAFNDNLGLERAKNARQYFLDLGVESEIATETMGKRRPVAPNSKAGGGDNPEGRQKNRRVNFVIN